MSFVLLALVIYYFVVLPVSRLVDRFQPTVRPAPTKECPWCLSKIPVKARRCAFCTADLQDRVQSTIERLTSDPAQA